MVAESAFNIDNPSFRALNALLGETPIGASALLVAGFVFVGRIYLVTESEYAEMEFKRCGRDWGTLFDTSDRASSF